MSATGRILFLMFLTACSAEIANGDPAPGTDASVADEADAMPNNSCSSGSPLTCPDGQADGCLGDNSETHECVACADLPPETVGCCPALSDNPEFNLHDAFVSSYPTMPDSIGGIQAFLPEINGNPMTYALLVSGGEIVDRDGDGVTTANIELGRDVAKQAAEESIPVGATIIAEKADAVIVNGTGCQGIGWGWGAFLYQDTDDTVSEVVYLYLGFCKDRKDIEAYYHSEYPLEVCDEDGGTVDDGID